jgi:hypothetical protein
MKKKVLIGVSICVVLIFILTSSVNVLGYQTVHSSNQKTINILNTRDVEIRAGVLEITNGDYGLGLLVIIKNDLTQEIEGDLIVSWDTLDGKNLKTYTADFNLVYGAEVRYQFHDRASFQYPIVTVTAMVTLPATSTFVLRSGFQIGRFVFF